MNAPSPIQPDSVQRLRGVRVQSDEHPTVQRPSTLVHTKAKNDRQSRAVTHGGIHLSRPVWHVPFGRAE